MIQTKLESWKVRAVRATKGNQSRLGCTVICMLGYSPLNPPRMRGTAVIGVDGIVVVDMELRNGLGFLATPVGHIHEIRDNMRGLADHLKLSDSERNAMFDELRKWISRDFRATSTPEE